MANRLALLAPISHVTQCRGVGPCASLYPRWETMAAFNCRLAAEKYATACGTSNLQLIYRVVALKKEISEHL